MHMARLQTAHATEATSGCHSGDRGGPINKVEQVSSDDHQMRLAGGWCGAELHVCCIGGRGTMYHVSGVGPCTVRSSASWVMVTWDPLWTE